MKFLNSLILDLAVISVLIIFAVPGFRKGAFKSFLGFLSSVFVSILSVFVAQKISLFVYDSFMYPYLEKTIEKLISETGLNAFEVFHKIPRFIASFLEARGITPQELNHIMNNSVSSTIPQKISQIIKPGILSVLKSIFALCAFVVLSMIAKSVSRYIYKIFSSSLLKGAFGILGSFFGFLKGYIVIAIFMCCLRTAVPFWSKIPDMFSAESISSSIIFKEFYNHNPVYEFLSNFN